MNKYDSFYATLRKTMFIISLCAFFLILYFINAINAVVLLFFYILYFISYDHDYVFCKPTDQKKRSISIVLSGVLAIFLLKSFFSIYEEKTVEQISFISDHCGLSYSIILFLIDLLFVISSLYFMYIFIYHFADGIGTVTKNIKINEIFRNIVFPFSDGLLKLIVCFLAKIIMSVLIGFVLLTIVMSIPENSIENNVKESAFYLSKEDTYEEVYDWCYSKLDNFTDSIMLLETVCKTDKPLLERTLYVYRDTIEGKNPHEVLADRYVNKAERTSVLSYPQYWHEYLVTLKPLLLFFNYQQIRVLNTILQMVLVFIICCVLLKKDRKEFVIPFIVSLLMMMPIVISKSLQYSTCYYLMLLFSLLVLFNDKLKLHYNDIFIFSGIATAYFDFLTYPLVNLCLPLIFFLICNNDKLIERKLSSIILYSTLFFLSYGSMWLGKWVFTDLLLNSRIVSTGINSVLYRTAGTAADGTKLPFLYVMSLNVNIFFDTPFAFLSGLFIILSVFIRKKNNINFDELVINGFPYCMISLFPFIWFMILRNHTAIHVFFASKVLFVSVFSILCVYARMYKEGSLV